MPGINPSSRFVFPPAWWRLALIIAAVGILAFALWTLPNWREFWDNLSQFPSLWQLSTNRKIILSLVIKIVSPFLLMGITGIIIWMYHLLKPSQSEEVSNHVHFEQAPKKERDRPPSSSTVEQVRQTGTVSFPTVSPTQPAAGSPEYNPETPLPPARRVSEALNKQAEKSQSNSLSSEDEASLPAEQQGENTSVGRNPTETSSSQIIDASEGESSEQRIDATPLISIRLLKDVSMAINIPGGGRIVVPLTLNERRVLLLSYIAWRRGELIDRDKILEHVFGWGLSDEEATEDKLSERFESHKKLLRKKIREVVIEQINKPAGREVINSDIDPFISNSGFWGLSDICRVDDLEIIENSYKVIALARKDGKLIEEIPEYVKEACERLIASYPGDFLASLIKKYPSEFRPWEGRSSWTRKPYTLYRDYYLDALWYAAEYDWRMGQRYTNNGSAEQDEVSLHKQQEHFGRAAQKYQNYAMYACNSKFDSKATFGAHGEFGARIGMSERALRRCVVLLGATGKTDLVNQVWSAYYTQMRNISDQRWQPSSETQADVQAARAQTNAYRFAAQVSQMSNEFAEREDRVS